MTAHKFPTYGTPDAARSQGCFVCLKPSTDAVIEDSGYPPGRGQWAMCCRHCGCWTFFDLLKAAA